MISLICKQYNIKNYTINDDGSISMTNDGNGIDIEKHPEYDIWIPELIFGHLLSGSNFDDSEDRIVVSFSINTFSNFFIENTLFFK